MKVSLQGKQTVSQEVIQRDVILENMLESGLDLVESVSQAGVKQIHKTTI